MRYAADMYGGKMMFPNFKSEDAMVNVILNRVLEVYDGNKEAAAKFIMADSGKESKP